MKFKVMDVDTKISNAMLRLEHVLTIIIIGLLSPINSHTFLNFYIPQSSLIFSLCGTVNVRTL